MDTFKINPPAYSEWRSYSIEYHFLLKYITQKSQEPGYTEADKENFLIILESQIGKFCDFLTATINEIWQRVEYCEQLIQTLPHLDSEGQEITIGEAGEVNAIATGQIFELMKYRLENFTALSKIVLRHKEITNIGITYEFDEMLKTYSITDENLIDRVIVRRLMRIYFYLQNGSIEGIADYLGIRGGSDNFETTITGWIDPEILESLIKKLQKNMDYYIDEDINEADMHADRQTPSKELVSDSESNSLATETKISNTNSGTKLPIEFDKSTELLHPIGYSTLYFDNKLNIYHDLLSSSKKSEIIKIRWRSGNNQQFPSNTSAIIEPTLVNDDKPASIQTHENYPVPIDFASIESEKYSEQWTGEPSVLERFYISKSGVSAFLASEYHIEKKKKKLEGNNWIYSHVNQPYSLFQQIQRKIVLENQHPTLRTHGYYYSFRSKPTCTDSQVDIQIIQNLRVLREDNLDGVERCGDSWFRLDVPELSSIDKSINKNDSKMFSPAIIKITLKNRMWPTWLYDLVFYQESVYWISNFDPYIYGVSMLMENHTHLLPYWCFEASHPSLTEDIYSSSFETDSSDSSIISIKINQTNGKTIEEKIENNESLETDIKKNTNRAILSIKVNPGIGNMALKKKFELHRSSSVSTMLSSNLKSTSYALAQKSENPGFYDPSTQRKDFGKLNRNNYKFNIGQSIKHHSNSSPLLSHLGINQINNYILSQPVIVLKKDPKTKNNFLNMESAPLLGNTFGTEHTNEIQQSLNISHEFEAENENYQNLSTIRKIYNRIVMSIVWMIYMLLKIIFYTIVLATVSAIVYILIYHWEEIAEYIVDILSRILKWFDSLPWRIGINLVF
ncbi:hypothetical protein BB558_004304 [Smittium angustum]|uniref:SPX domain-containing protein n=2 Tax=Harpellales TaxID=61421 RepID=A0A2U1J3J8_SMIAN|nr:hypothetical protein BB558_004304 [Smittium angustum]